MNKAIVTTTINAPTEALKKFAAIATRDDWHLIIVGDKKTPHADYEDMVHKYECVTYLSPEDQEMMDKALSDAIGWNCIQRRNFGFIYAYQNGAEIMATVDDDNIPNESWGKNLMVNKKSEYVLFKSAQELFDPISVTHPHLWHRGFPIQLLSERKINNAGLKKRQVLVQADMWDGDPDVDAVARITLAPEVKFNPSMLAFGSDKPGPFNSQNTFLSRKIFPDYFLFPHIGRMDDIWAAYYIQAFHPDSVVYNKATVFQKRNEHDLSKDLENEIIGYKNSLNFATWCKDLAKLVKFKDFYERWPDYIPNETIEAFRLYRQNFK